MQSTGAAHPARMETRKARSTPIVPARARNSLIRVTLIGTSVLRRHAARLGSCVTAGFSYSVVAGQLSASSRGRLRRMTCPFS